MFRDTVGTRQDEEMRAMEKARKGDLCAYEVRRSYTRQGGETVRFGTWHLGIVDHATRRGLVRYVIPLDPRMGRLEIHAPDGYQAANIGGSYVASADTVDMAAVKADETLRDGFQNIYELRGELARHKR